MSIVVNYGNHGLFEPQSIELGRSLEAHPVPGVIPWNGHPELVARGDPSLRQIHENKAIAYPNADPNSPISERRAAAADIAFCEAVQPSLIIDWHTTRAHHSTAIYLHPSASRFAMRIAVLLKVPDIIFADFNIGSRFEDTITVDVSEADERFMDIVEWRRELADLATLDPDDIHLPSREAMPRIWLHAGTITVNDLLELDLEPKVTMAELERYVAKQPYAKGGVHTIRPDDPFLSFSEDAYVQLLKTNPSQALMQRGSSVFAWSSHYLPYGGIAECLVPAPLDILGYIQGSGVSRPRTALANSPSVGAVPAELAG